MMCGVNQMFDAIGWHNFRFEQYPPAPLMYAVSNPLLSSAIQPARYWSSQLRAENNSWFAPEVVRGQARNSFSLVPFA